MVPQQQTLIGMTDLTASTNHTTLGEYFGCKASVSEAAVTRQQVRGDARTERWWGRVHVSESGVKRRNMGKACKPSLTRLWQGEQGNRMGQWNASWDCLWVGASGFVDEGKRGGGGGGGGHWGK